MKILHFVAKTCLLLLFFLLLLSFNSSPAMAQNVEEYFDEFAQMARETAARFGGSVAAYEIWNEEDLHGPSSFYLPPEIYAPLLRAAYSAIKEVSSSQVIIGGLASGNTGYLTSVISALGGSLPADGIGLHPYAQYTQEALRSVLNNYLHPSVSQGKPLWITEFGWETTNQIAQADYLTMAANTFGTFGERIIAPTWYCWSDVMNSGFGLITANGDRKEAYRRFPSGYGVNIDPGHPYPHTPKAADLQRLGAGWVRLVYRPRVAAIDFDSLIREYSSAGIRVILILNQETLWTENLPVPGGPAEEGCPPAKRGNALLSRRAHTAPEALVEVKRDCSGLNAIRCFLESFWSWVQETLRKGGHPVPRSFAYGMRANINQTIKWAQTIGLWRGSATRPYDGIVARMLPPGYRQQGLDPVAQLTNSEGQMSEGFVKSNYGTQMGISGDASGAYDVEWFGPGHEISSYWLYIPAFFYKFDLIRQTFVPRAPRANIPRVRCGTPHEEATIIKEQAGDPNLRHFGRNVIWKLDDDPDCNATPGEAGENGVCPYNVEVECVPTDPDDPDCTLPVGEEGEDNRCPCRGTGSTRITAPLATQTRVALAAEGWQALAGGKGALDIFKFPASRAAPDGWMFRREDNNEVAGRFTYYGESGETTTPRLDLWVRDLGKVRDSLECIVGQLLMPPSTAARGVCENVIVKPKRIACEQPPECWRGSPLNMETEGREGCINAHGGEWCTNDAYHEIVPACTYMLDAESLHYVLICYGNNYRKCATDGHFLPPLIGEKREGWIGAGEFPGGRVLYNGYTYTPPSDYPWSGVYWCDSNAWGCQNQVCLQGGTLVPSGPGLVTLGEAIEERKLAEEKWLRQLVAGPGQAAGSRAHKENKGFFTRLADTIGHTIRAIFNL